MTPLGLTLRSRSDVPFDAGAVNTERRLTQSDVVPPGFDIPSRSMKNVVFCHDHPDGEAFDPDPSETAQRSIKLGHAIGNGQFAAVGWRRGGLAAAKLAATMPDRVDRLVLCCVPAPIDHDPDFDPRDIAAKTLLLFGQADPDAPSQHARWWKSHLQNARVEMVPGAGSDIIHALWKRTLSHAAPNSLRT